MYWHGILDYSGRDNRRLKEIQTFNKTVQKLVPVAGAEYVAKVGVLKDYDNIFDAEYDVWHKSVDEVSQKNIFEVSQKTHTPIDYVYLTGNMSFERLSKYDLLIYPHMTIVNPKHLEPIREFVKNGGKLIIGCRSGYKDITGRCVMEKLPGMLTELTGCDIPEYTYIAPDTENVTINWDDENIEAAVS